MSLMMMYCRPSTVSFYLFFYYSLFACNRNLQYGALLLQLLFSSVCRRCLHGACCRCQPARSAATAAVIKSLPVLSFNFAKFSLYQKTWRLVFISVRYHHLLLQQQQQQQPLTDNFPTDNC